MLWPVAVGCALIAALWFRARLRDREHGGRWGLVLLPMALAPLAGMGSAHAACVASGGWSVGVGLLGVIAQGLAMLLLGGVAMRFARRELRIVVGPRLPAARTTGIGALFMLSGLARVALLVVSLWSLTPELHPLHEGGLEVMLAGEHGLYGRLLVLLAAVAIAPPAEEVLFRGLLLPGLAQSMKPRAALFVSSAVFGLFHVPSHGTAAVLPGILGLAFGWARLRSGSLKAPIALHVANNLLVTLLTWATW
jgi:membrane protease YdiL (CAAX protease family)